ncbi:UDP-N-acetylmuramoylalanyl-D-glutamyl-2,6-diaminopimelate--D-alanyl-D-alanine ligase [Ahrensia kielensis]|uniref:UDP-N-acetylmuramoylalanyl-D-glutamyl-2, 6-diaminopimelate--D-alanyl-D-alanine ligase n=1 Tax=Ahrensia kielensis TaxID=76980 RepID=UPI00247FF66D|nr:UDP-N-acetylmuramoylalanyl-D-glutamyl-2,6-diaminopimelate--D-alanyl-D-alanine ligase [Ahrensia kielensis]
MPLWTGQAMVEAMHARPVHGVPDEITGISIDTRTLQKGEAFFAIKGDRVDGHDYATAAAAAGAAVLVIDEKRLPSLGRIQTPLMVVDDVLHAMELLGKAARARSKAKIIAVTGSAGKTTTKDALAHALATCGRVHASAASFNNHWGVPLTLARMPEETEYGIFEIGMNHAGEITPLAKMVQPHIAIVTLVAAAHMGHFKTLDDIAHAKGEIFSGLVRGGTAIINRDDKRFKLLSEIAEKSGVKNIVGYGANRRGDVVLKNAEYLDDCTTAIAKVFGQEVAFKVSVPGKHVVQNMLAILTTAHLVEADMCKVSHSLARLTASDGRGRHYELKVSGGTFTLIDESYNANPASMEAALEMLASMNPKGRGRRIAVLGDMLEMGKFSQKLHAALADPLARFAIKDVYLAGSEMIALEAALGEEFNTHYFEDADSLAKEFTEVPSAGDVIMVKSSNGIGFSKIVKALLKAYSAA